METLVAVQVLSSLGFEVAEAPGLTRPHGSAETVYWVRNPYEIGGVFWWSCVTPEELTTWAETLCGPEGRV